MNRADAVASSIAILLITSAPSRSLGAGVIPWILVRYKAYILLDRDKMPANSTTHNFLFFSHVCSLLLIDDIVFCKITLSCKSPFTANHRSL